MSDSYRLQIGKKLSFNRMKKQLTHVEKNSQRAKSAKTRQQEITQDTFTYQPLLTQQNRNDLLSSLSQDYELFRSSRKMPSHRIKTAQPICRKLNLQNDDEENKIDQGNQIQGQMKNEIQEFDDGNLKRKISQENITLQDGKRIPFKLHLRNQMRKYMYSDLDKLKSYLGQQDHISVQTLKNDIAQQFKPEQDKLMQTIFQAEKNKKLKEYRSRSAYDNSYCQILALNKKSRNNLQEKFVKIFPIESRYQLRKFNFEKLNNQLVY